MADETPRYWRRVDHADDPGGTYEHPLPNGGMLVMVLYNGTAVIYVPPMPRPPGPALRSEPWESGVAREPEK